MGPGGAGRENDVFLREKCAPKSWRKATTAILLILAASPALALPTQSWNGYHWARTGQLSVRIGDNVSAAWDPFVNTAITEWSAAKNIDFVHAAGLTAPSTCAPVYGGVQACSGNYGATGWLGYATVWTSGGFIVQATVKLNDYYFAQARYNTAAWRSLVSCQEIGHTLGLAHNDTIFTDPNKGTCLDYTNDPTGTKGTNGTLANTAPGASDFLALDGIYATLDSTQLSYTRPQFRTGDGFSIGEDIDGDPVAVPEPATWTLLIAGFIAVGSAARRRRTRPIAA